ncbi:MAG: hypothetical protein R6V28_11790 [Nitriliruptoraceae bacterium]
MTRIDVTPAGNQLYQVDIEDREGRSRHEVGVPDALLMRLDVRGLAMRDVVHAAVDFLVEQVGRQDLDPEVDLGVEAERYQGFDEQVPARARQRASSAEPPTGMRTTDRDAPSGNERLLAEVEEEQRQGRASHPERRA